MKITAIILAAGQGKRMGIGIPKQYLELGGKPVLFYSVYEFEKSPVDEIILVVGKEQTEKIRRYFSPQNGFYKVKAVIAGGRERYDSVYCGLKAAEDAGYVLIHDGARPFIDGALIARMIDGAKRDCACAAGMPAKDTIKTADTENWVTSTPDRSKVWMIQTPQAFLYTLIREAYERLFLEESNVRIPVTDDAMVAELTLGERVRLIEGSYENIKITTPEDLQIAEAIFKRRREREE